MIDFLLDISEETTGKGLSGLFINKPEEIIHYNGPDQELLLWGDPSGGAEFVRNIKGEILPEQILSNVYGHYYFLILNRKENMISAGNSVFSILPVYYYETGGRVVLSSNAFDLGRYLGQEVISRRFILETILFNYPVFNHSIFENISLFAANSYMRIRHGNVSFVKHTSIEDYYSIDPVPWQRAADTVSDAFIETVKRYLPSEKYVNALTGGFDSRTLVATGLASGGDLLCYSFGAPGSKDVDIPDRVAALAGLPYQKLLLDDDYARKESLKNGLEFIRNASGSASFARAHYLYAAKTMASHSRYMITGNFGSELFRAANVRGVVFPPNLIALFSSGDPDTATDIIAGSREFSSLRKESFRTEWDQLKQDLGTLPSFNKEHRHLTVNQKFYLFVFEEVFRKYFGAEMTNQFRYLINRTPYIDPAFLRIILGTGFAGVYSDFFEHNPFKRYKGQVLYAHIIRKTRPDLGRIVTDKGYCTNDLLTLPGKIRVIRGYLRKKINKAGAQSDPYSVDRAFLHNVEFYRQVPVDFELFNPNFLTDAAFARPDGHLIMMLSLSMAMAAVEGGEFPFIPAD